MGKKRGVVQSLISFVNKPLLSEQEIENDRKAREHNDEKDRPVRYIFPTSFTVQG